MVFVSNPYELTYRIKVMAAFLKTRKTKVNCWKRDNGMQIQLVP